MKKNHHNRIRGFCLAAVLLCAVFPLSADIYSEFVFINENYIGSGESLFSVQRLETYSPDGKVSEIPSYSIISRTSQFTSVMKDGREINFLSTGKGYWISNSSLRNPLKVSGSYQIEEIAVQDILRFNFDTDFSVAEKNDASVSLERKNKKISYAYAVLEKQDGSFVLTLQDSKKNNVKKIVYSPGVIGDRKLFTRIFIYNLAALALDSADYRCYVTQSVHPVKAAASLFAPENMRILEKLGKSEYEKCENEE